MNLLAQSQAITLFFRKAQFNISAWLLCGGRFSDESEKQKKKKKLRCVSRFYLFILFIYFILLTIEGPCRVGNYIIFKASNTMEDVANVATNVTSNEIQGL